MRIQQWGKADTHAAQTQAHQGAKSVSVRKKSRRARTEAVPNITTAPGRRDAAMVWHERRKRAEREQMPERNRVACNKNCTSDAGSTARSGELQEGMEERQWTERSSVGPRQSKHQSAIKQGQRANQQAWLHVDRVARVHSLHNQPQLSGTDKNGLGRRLHAQTQRTSEKPETMGYKDAARQSTTAKRL